VRPRCHFVGGLPPALARDWAAVASLAQRVPAKAHPTPPSSQPQKYEVSLVMILDQCDNQPSPSCFHADDRILTSVLHRQISTSLARCMVSTHREDFLPRFVLFLLPRESRDSRSYSKIKKYPKSRILTEIPQSRSPVNFPQLASPRHSLLHHRVIVLPDSTFSFVDSVQGRDLKTTRILTTNPFSAASSAGAIAS